ncbi:hypothetical protein C2I17_16720 [Niallia circulans]|uniref:hypothetical protein n=1 Tax=Niallia circulans TaxID=1397 RepID=UPI00201D8F2F|nr:hypothetical protein [Niallia circulans]UQZ76064.1 hypothetical protein C2I17_16720 [Niallia circulans]
MIEQFKNRTFIIFGSGSLAFKVISECEKNSLHISYIVDNDISKHNQLFKGYIIKKPEDIKLNENEIILIASSYSIDIQRQLRDLSFRAEIDYINYNLMFPYLSPNMKFSGVFEELNSIGELLNYSIDDVGVLLKKEDEFYRAIYHNKVEDTKNILKVLKEENFYNECVIKTEITEKSTKNFPLILKHPYIKYCSDIRSWSFSMIKEGFDVIANLLVALNKNNLTLKDAHGLNLTYYEGKHRLIDFGSIIKGNLKLYVIKELVESFIFPCVMMVNGQSLEFYKHNYYSGIKYFMIKSFLDEEGLNIFNELYNEEDINKDPYLILTNIQNWSRNYFVKTQNFSNTLWGDYQKINTKKNPENMDLKEKTVLDFLRTCNGNTLIDIAGNNGWYCYSANKNFNMSGILVDFDFNCIENAYFLFKKEKVNFVPLVNDFNNFPNNLFFLKQDIKFDVVLCLAFIHHLIFNNGFSFEKVRDSLHEVTNEYLIIEFINPIDEYVSTWINPYFSWYNKRNFEIVFSEKYSIESVNSVSESREIYLMKKR